METPMYFLNLEHLLGCSKCQRLLGRFVASIDDVSRPWVGYFVFFGLGGGMILQHQLQHIVFFCKLVLHIFHWYICLHYIHVVQRVFSMNKFFPT